jgi:uncharacterized repeat protein (TIGR01451 family)
MILAVSTLNFTSPQPLIGKVAALDWPGADIQLVKSVNATTIHSGDAVQYTLNVTNVGNTTLYNVTVIDDTLEFLLDPVSFSPMLTPGQSNVTLATIIIGGAPGTLTNIATANGTTQEGYTVTDNATATVTIVDPSVIFPSIESCDSTGVKKDNFNVGDNLYVNGTGFENFTSYSLYVVEDQSIWVDNMTIPTRVLGTATTVYSDADGNIPPTIAWSNPLVPGKYDIVVDVNGNGRYDVNIDALDNNDIMVTAGIFVIPEVTIGSVMAIASMFTALGLYAYKKKSTQ